MHGSRDVSIWLITRKPERELTKLSDGDSLLGSFALDKDILGVSTIVKEKLPIALTSGTQKVFVGVISEPGRIDLVGRSVSRCGKEERNARSISREPSKNDRVESLGVHGSNSLRLCGSVRVTDSYDLIESGGGVAWNQGTVFELLADSVGNSDFGRGLSYIYSIGLGGEGNSQSVVCQSSVSRAGSSLHEANSQSRGQSITLGTS
jgi:hypothetical protein